VKPASIAAAFAWATGAWASLGVVAVTSQSTIARAGFLPPLWVLAALAIGAAVVVSWLRLSRDDTAPLWLALAAWFPWLPGPIPPAFLVFDGPLARVVVLLAAALVVGRALARVAPAIRFSVRSHLALAFAIAAIASVLAAWRLAPVLPDGDEPHYLVITQSLLYDGDLQIENNHRRGDYMAYAGRELRPDFHRRGRNGAIYSIHAPGVSALVLPAFAAGGYSGVVVFLALLFGVAGALTWRASYQLTGDATSAWIGWMGVILSAPAFFHSFTVYPDGPAALVVIGVVFLGQGRRREAEEGGGPQGAQAGLTPLSPPLPPLPPFAPLCLSLPPAAPWQWLIAGAAIAVLPWLHTRLSLVAVVLLVVSAFRIVTPSQAADAGTLRGSPTYRLLALLALPATSVALWLAFFHAIYGTIDPRAPYGGNDGQFISAIPHGLTGLLIDQQFGLLPNAPIYVVALAGLAALWRTHRRLAIELSAVAIPYGVVVSANEMWWAGFSAPARFLVPVLLPMALPLAAWWQRHDGRVARAFASVALGASLAITATLTWTGRGALLYNGHDGFALWLDLAAPAVSLARAEPTVFRGSLAATWLMTLIWCVIAVACWWALCRLEPSTRRAGAWTFIAGAAMLAALIVAVQLAWTVDSAKPIETGSSELRLLAAACEPHLSSAVAGRLPGMVIPDASRRPQAQDRAAWSGHDVAPGRYDVMLNSTAASSGSLTVAVGRADVIVETCAASGVAPGAAACAIDLPAGAESLWVQADGGLRTTVSSVGLLLEKPSSAEACGLRARRAVVDGARVLYVVEGLVYTKRDGVWVLGGAEGRFVASGPAPATVRLQNGPVPNHIAVWNAGWRDDWDAQPGAFRDVQVPTPRPGSDPSFTVAASTGFESGAVDAGLRGRRSLGVWVSLHDFGKTAASLSATHVSALVPNK
jgi:hypothetical protein